MVKIKDAKIIEEPKRPLLVKTGFEYVISLVNADEIPDAVEKTINDKLATVYPLELLLHNINAIDEQEVEILSKQNPEKVNDIITMPTGTDLVFVFDMPVRCRNILLELLKSNDISTKTLLAMKRLGKRFNTSYVFEISKRGKQKKVA